MKRYFFDVISQAGSAYDYRGREFPSPEQAYQMAELMALDLQLCPPGEWAASSINVRDSFGTEFFTMRVQPPELQAA
jgi:hypothetical protein